jgi:DNA polymerase-3 subunit gamma/tau
VSSKKILLEVTLLKCIEARNSVSLDSVLKRLQDLRGGENSANIPAPERRVAAKPEPQKSEPAQRQAEPARVAATPQNAFTETSQSAASPGDSNLESLWANLVETVGRASPFTRSYLLEAHPVSFAKSVFIIGFAPEFEDHIGLVDNSRNHALLQTKLAELGHPNAQFKFIKAEPPANRQISVAEPPPAPAQSTPKTAEPPAQLKSAAPASTLPAKEKPAPVAFNKDDFKNDPLIQKALEIFKGRIVEVRA